MKYCVNCGNENKDDAKFCQTCGNKFDNEEVFEAEHIENNTYNYNVNMKNQSSLGKVSMILGIIAVSLCVVCCCFPIGIILGPAAIALGIIYLVKNKNSSKGMAIAGIVLGSIALAFAIFVFVIEPIVIEEMQDFVTKLCELEPDSDECQIYKEAFPEWFE